jgi:hypothetical protein
MLYHVEQFKVNFFLNLKFSIIMALTIAGKILRYMRRLG